jgi:hypothetical protein
VTALTLELSPEQDERPRAEAERLDKPEEERSSRGSGWPSG